MVYKQKDAKKIPGQAWASTRQKKVCQADPRRRAAMQKEPPPSQVLPKEPQDLDHVQHAERLFGRRSREGAEKCR